MKEITKIDEFDQFINSGDNVKVVDFYAEWCQPCQRFFKIADRVEEELSSLGAEIVKVNAEIATDISAKYGITKYPTFHYYHNGLLQMEYYGIRPIAQMQEIVNNILDNG